MEITKSPNEECDRPDPDVHPLDEVLGNIHGMVLGLHLAGYADSAQMLGRAHEAIQRHLVEQDTERDRLGEINQRLEADLERMRVEIQVLQEDLGAARLEGK